LLAGASSCAWAVGDEATVLSRSRYPAPYPQAPRFGI